MQQAVATTGYRGPNVCKIVGISYRQLDYWARTGLATPSVQPDEWITVDYTATDNVGLAWTVVHLTGAGLAGAALLALFHQPAIDGTLVEQVEVDLHRVEWIEL